MTIFCVIVFAIWFDQIYFKYININIPQQKQKPETSPPKEDDRTESELFEPIQDILPESEPGQSLENVEKAKKTVIEEKISPEKPEEVY